MGHTRRPRFGRHDCQVLCTHTHSTHTHTHTHTHTPNHIRAWSDCHAYTTRCAHMISRMRCLSAYRYTHMHMIHICAYACIRMRACMYTYAHMHVYVRSIQVHTHAYDSQMRICTCLPTLALSLSLTNSFSQPQSTSPHSPSHPLSPSHTNDFLVIVSALNTNPSNPEVRTKTLFPSRQLGNELCHEPHGDAWPVG